MADYDIGPIPGSNSEGIEIRGLDVNSLDQEEVRAELNRLWLQHGVIVFRGIASPESHVRLSKVFGECQTHPVQQSNTDPNFPELTNVQYAPDGKNGNIYEVNGVQLGAWLPLHYDLVYVDKVNHGGLLRPIVIPEQGGGTLFVDKIRLYDTLSDEMKKRIEGLEVYYKLSMNMSKMKYPVDDVKLVYMGDKFRDIESRLHLYPRSIHPLVYAQEGTGRKMLNLSPWFAEGIVGMENEEGDALLQELCRHVVRSKDIYCHRWQEGDLVLWDNWRVLHGAEGVPPNATRWVQRTTITGDYALGRLEQEKAGSDEARRIDV
jgi:taurine dioxygenase